MNGLRSHIKNSKECFIRYPNTSKSVKKTRLRLVFSTHFSGFGYPDETLFLVFDILLETSLTSHDEELVSIQSGLNYHSEIAEAFASSQNQIDDRVNSITTEYRQVEPECSISQLSSGSCFEDPSADTQREDSETTSTDDSSATFLHEGDPHVCETLDELTGGGEMYLKMVKDLSSGNGVAARCCRGSGKVFG